jgi:hypothetical protein
LFSQDNFKLRKIAPLISVPHVGPGKIKVFKKYLRMLAPLATRFRL